MKKKINKKIKELNKRLNVMKIYLDMKREEEEWHGIEDAASDIRDIEAQIYVLEEILND